MYMRIFISLIIVVAIVVGGLVFTSILSRDQLVKLISFRDFFDVALPILAFGALVKYLCTGSCGTCRTCQCRKK